MLEDSLSVALLGAPGIAWEIQPEFQNPLPA
jgi:hypothetical protein